jgi:iron(III) transport system ATP-binding protein
MATGMLPKMGDTLSSMPNTAVDEHPAQSGSAPTRSGAACIGVERAVKAFDGPEVLREVSVDVSPGEIVALLGPSGCGKTTLLRCIAGLERLDAGVISIDGTTVSGPGVHRSPQSRQIGMVFQDWALFPHLSVERNVAYGLSRDDRRAGRVTAALESVGLAGMHQRHPGTLSGGQQQRVALARALAPEPRALLLDEPFSNLDTSLRVQVRTEVLRLLTELGITTIFVTHDQEEAFVLGDRVAVMNDGVIEQYGTPAEIYETPASRWVAEFVGEANLIEATASGAMAHTPVGPVRLLEQHHGPVSVVVRPEHLSIAPGATARVELIEYYGHDHVLVIATADGQRVRVRRPGSPIVTRGQSVDVIADDSPAVAFATG